MHPAPRTTAADIVPDMGFFLMFFVIWGCLLGGSQPAPQVLVALVAHSTIQPFNPPKMKLLAGDLRTAQFR